MRNIPTNTTLLYARYTDVYITKEADNVQQSGHTHPNLTLLNITNSRVDPQALYEFLLYLPNLRILLLQNASIKDSNLKFFRQLQKMQILDLQGNHIIMLKSRFFTGASEVVLLNLNSMSIHKIQSKTFEGMASLQLLNLSYNNLEHLSDDIVQSLDSLSKIDLRGNDFKDIHSYTFNGLDATIYTSKLHLCCFVPPTSTCYVTDLR